MIEITEYNDLSEPRLCSLWDALESEGACPSLFATRTWVTAWAEQFGGAYRPVFLVGRSDGDAVGLASLFSGARGEVFLPVNFLSPRGELVAAEAQWHRFAGAVLSHVSDSRLKVYLRGMPIGSPSLTGVRTAARATGFLLHERPGRDSPFIAVDGSWDDYYRSRSRKVTHEWERKMRKLEGSGDVSVRTFEPGAEVAPLVDAFIDVESRSWKERNGTSIRARGVERFYHAVCAALAERGTFRPFWIELDGRVIAFLLGAVHGRVYYALKTSYDERFSNLSPGVRLFHDAVRHAFGASLARFDFLGERARWKDEWATGRLPHLNVTLYPWSVKGLAEFAVDSYIKPVVRRARGSTRGTP